MTPDDLAALCDAAMPGIAPLESGLTSGGKPYVVSMFVTGSSLEQYVARKRRSADSLNAIAAILQTPEPGLHCATLELVRDQDGD